MSTPPPPPPGGFPPGYQPPGGYPPGGGIGRRIEEAMELIQMELRHAVAYVNEAVVPQVRRESISAMRSVADTLHNLADKLDRRTEQQPDEHPPRGPKP